MLSGRSTLNHHLSTKLSFFFLPCLHPLLFAASLSAAMLFSGASSGAARCAITFRLLELEREGEPSRLRGSGPARGEGIKENGGGG